MDKKPIKETDIQKEILDWLTAQGIFCWRNNTQGTWDAALKMYRKPGGKHAMKGVSDILGIMPSRYPVLAGKILTIEVKKPGGKISEAQALFLGKVNSEGGVGFIAFSLQDVKDRLGERLK
jgi:hypothetical protein